MTQTIEQVWFAGVRSDVGGWYENRGLSNISLHWMLNRAQACGLRLPILQWVAGSELKNLFISVSYVTLSTKIEDRKALEGVLNLRSWNWKFESAPGFNVAVKDRRLWPPVETK